MYRGSECDQNLTEVSLFLSDCQLLLICHKCYKSVQDKILLFRGELFKSLIYEMYSSFSLKSNSC